MSGGVFSKLGNWFEEDGVIGHLLRIADEQERTLLWEGVLTDELGVDCWVQTDSGRIAEQYKTRHDGTWSIGDLARTKQRADGTPSHSVLSYASTQLQRTDGGGATAYRFVTTKPAPDLEIAIEAAQRTADPAQWLNGTTDHQRLRVQLMEGLRLLPDEAESIMRAHDLVRRMRVQVIDRQTLRDYNQTIARTLSPTAPDLLVESVRSLARMSLGREMTSELVRRHLAEAGVALIDQIGRQRAGDVLDAAAGAFTRSTTGVRQLSLIERPEADAAVAAVTASDRARTVIIHGPAGAGKTEVLLQLVTKLRAAHVPTLVMRADEADRPPLAPDPVRALSRYAGGKRACLVIDQLDQVVLAGDRAQHLIKPLAEWIVLARALEITVVVGCRTIDVEQDTHLRRVLCPDDADRFRKIPIGDLSETQATTILSEAGIPVETIHPDLVPLTRRPLVLHLLTQLVSHGGTYAPARTILDLVVRWWDHLRKPNDEAADAVLNAMAAAVERDGKLSIARLHLPHPSVIDALLASGVLIDEGRGVIRPFHQVVVDVWLARQWSAVTTFSDLQQRIGERRDQTLHHARRLRLSVQLFASRGERGAALCADIIRSPEVRPLLKRALLLGIAVIDQPDDDWKALVIRWLEDSAVRDIVISTVVYQRVAWMDALGPWLLRAWNSATPEQRQQLLRLLAGIGSTRGDLVASCLQAWSQSDPTVLSQAELVFWHDPSADSDRLFDLRLQFYIESRHQRDHFLKWGDLFSGNPSRAARLFAYHLERATDDDLLQRNPDWFHGWPAAIPAPVFTLGVSLWDKVRDRWHRLTVRYPWEIRIDRSGRYRDTAVIVHLVDLLSGALAFALDHGQITWATLLAQCPPGNRFIDSWLLLRIGAALDARVTPSMVLKEAIRWFMGDAALGQLGIGMAYESSRFAEAFLKNISASLDDCLHQELEQWLVEYPERLAAITTTPEVDAVEELKRTTAIGYRLLNQLDRSRCSSATLALHASLTERFGGIEPPDEDAFTTRGGWVRSDITDDRAMEMTCAEWVEALRSATSTGDWRPSPTDDDSLLSSDLTTRLRQLQYIVPHHPRRFLEGLPLVMAAIPPLPGEVLTTVVDGIVRKTPPDRPPPRGPWEPLDDASVAGVFALPRILNDRRMALTLTDVVRNRSEYPWSDDIIARLTTLGTGASAPGMKHSDQWGLITYRLNEPACRAVDALANIAHDQEKRRAALLDLAESLVGHEDAGRRASAAMLALHSRSVDVPRAFALVLRVAKDPQLAAEDDIGKALLFIIQSEDALPEQKNTSLAILLGLIGDDERLARHGGHAALLLRAWEVITPEVLTHELSRSPKARQAAATTLANGLQVEKAPDVWMRDLAVSFANDDDEGVGDAILRAFDGDSEHLLQIPDFFTAMVRSKATRRDPQDMLKLCCTSGDIVTIADDVLHLAEGLTTVQVTAEEHWQLAATLDVAVNALQALVARAEQVGNSAVRSRALDAWDRLIEREELVAQNKLNAATDFSVG